VKEIPLTQGKVALVDDEDFEDLNAFKWHAHWNGRHFYAMRRAPRPNNKLIRMHRQIMNTPDGFDTDHCDGNGLNNRKINLRICTRNQNNCNTRKHKNNTTGFKGIILNKRVGNFQAKIGVNGKQVSLGYFQDPYKAALVYDAAAIRIYGEFARPNFPEKKVA
jgi:hypothetical protein